MAEPSDGVPEPPLPSASPFPSASDTEPFPDFSEEESDDLLPVSESDNEDASANATVYVPVPVFVTVAVVRTFEPLYAVIVAPPAIEPATVEIGVSRATKPSTPFDDILKSFPLFQPADFGMSFTKSENVFEGESSNDLFPVFVVILNI